MPNASNVQFNEIDISFNVAGLLKGISFLEGITKRGPINNPKTIITSVEQFDKLHGGLLTTSDFPLLVRRALEYGAQLRVNRVAHYTSITDKSTLTALLAAFNDVEVLTFDADLIAANQFDLDINAVAITPVVFNTDNDTTLGLIATEIASNAAVAQAIVVETGTASDRVILAFPADNAALAFTNAAVTAGASQAGVVNTQQVGVHDALGNILFSLPLKYKGVDYNNVTVTIAAASNGDANSFDLTIAHALETDLTETYTNIIIPGTPTASASAYLDIISQSSKLVDVQYNDLSALTSPIRPQNAVYYETAGSDGAALVDLDYVGDSGEALGFNAFDTYDDALNIAAPEVSASAVHIGGGAYADTRKDLVYFAHLGNASNDATTLISDRDGTNIDSAYVGFYGGGLRITHPTTGLEVEISELADVIGIAARSDTEFAEWYSFAGGTRGKVRNALGVVNNFGTPGKAADLNLLAQRQINMVVEQNNRLLLNGNFTAQLANSKLSFMGTRRGLIFLQKSLKPILVNNLEEPGDIITFKKIFREVRPFLDSLVAGRFFFDYRWRGDQDISKIEDVVVNDLTDLDNGKYKIQLFAKIIPALNEIRIDIVVTPTSVDFDIIEL